MLATSATRVTTPILVAFSTVLVLIVPGCGPGTPDVDKAAFYTPESLASELAFRYRALNPDARTSSRKAKSDKGLAERVARNAKVEKKGAGLKKAAGPTTIDTVLDDINDKLDLIKETSRSESCRKMIEALSKDSSLTESDKKALTDLVGRLADGR